MLTQQWPTKILSQLCSEWVWKLTLVVELEHFCFPNGHHCSFQLDCCWQYDIMNLYVEDCNLATYKQHRNESALAVAGEVHYSVSSLRRPMKIQTTLSWLLTLPYIKRSESHHGSRFQHYNIPVRPPLLVLTMCPHSWDLRHRSEVSLFHQLHYLPGVRLPLLCDLRVTSDWRV